MKFYSQQSAADEIAKGSIYRLQKMVEKKVLARPIDVPGYAHPQFTESQLIDAKRHLAHLEHNVNAVRITLKEGEVIA